MIMLNSLKMIFNRLLEDTSMQFKRYLFEKIQLDSRLIGLIGPRGVGKTTLLLQLIKAHYPELSTVFYFSADHIYFKTESIYGFIEHLFLHQGIQTFFIDEIHQYPNWSQELKNIYDGFPKINIIFSGSSSLDLKKGSYDLSRRAHLYHLPGLSFREYLNYEFNESLQPKTLEDLLLQDSEAAHEISKIPNLLSHFNNYLRQGFYPFFKEHPTTYYQKLLQVIDKTIYEDITNFYNMKTSNLRHLSKILNFLASTPPGEVSTYNLGKNLSIDDKTASHYLNMLQETGLVEIIYAQEQGNAFLRKPEKVFLNNTNLHFSLVNHFDRNPEIGTVRELSFIQSTKNAALQVYYSKIGDYRIGEHVFEIGGKNKTKHQIQGISSAFLVKDDTLIAFNGSIPLAYFGFLY